jgi:ribosomal protein S1
MADVHIAYPSGVLSIAQHTRVRVLRVERQQHRPSLSLKQVLAAGEPETSGALAQDGRSSVTVQG